MLYDCILIFGASLACSLLAEAISWLLIYRTEDYKKLKATIDRLQKRLDKKKEETSSISNKGKDKKFDRYEETLKNVNRDMAMSKMKSTFAVGFALIAVFGMLNSSFDGYTVVKLPFEPFSLLTGISHRNLPGNDFRDCSMVFFYILCSTCIRTNIQKILGTAPPRTSPGQTPSPWG